MHLKKLILHGFKSFADRTEFVFDAPLVGIVGPNGCGKSNIVDAFRWVLGEQSAKNLRGDAMMDVIFNGSASRGPSGMAEVILVFDNSRRPDGTRILNIDADEVQVGRRLFRDGTSQYQLNNHDTRLRDIRELFLDTGVGMDAYSVIEQGKVAAMLDSNPQERRLIFEEAAGISKYKLKKKEAQRKLERVEQNLLRLQDIVQEVEKRLRSVRIQAGRARTFKEYSEHLAELRLTYALREYHALRVQDEELQRQREDARFRLDDIGGELQRQQNLLAAQQQSLEAATQARQQAEYDLLQTKTQIESCQQRQQYALQQLAQVAEQLEAFRLDRQAMQQRIEQAADALELEQEQYRQLTEQLESARLEIQNRQESFRQSQLQLNDLNQRLEQQKNVILELMRKLATADNRLSAVQIEARNCLAQQDRLSSRLQVVGEQAGLLRAQQAHLQQELAEVEALLSRQQSQVADNRSAAAALGRQIEQIARQLAAAKEHRSGLVSRHNLLSDLESRREGVSEGVKCVLRQRHERFGFVRGIVADVLKVDVENAHVIEAALNGQDQTLIAESQQAVAEAREALEELSGRVSFLCVDRLPACEQGDARPELPWCSVSAMELVKYEPADRPIVQHLLGKTVVVDDLQTACELHRSGPGGWRYVTREGHVVESDGTVRAGPLAASMGLLSRRSELEALVGQIAEVDARVESLAQRLAADNAEAHRLDEELDGLRQAIHQSNTSKVELGSQISQIEDQLSALEREKTLLDQELAQLQQQIVRLKQEESDLAAQKQAYEAELSACEQQVQQMSAQQQQIAEDLRRMGEELTACRVTASQMQEKQLASEQAVQRLIAQQLELSQQIERIDKSSEQARARQASIEHELAAARHAETSLINLQQEHAARVAKLAAQHAQAQQQIAELSQAVENLRQQYSAIESQLHGIELQAGQVKVRIEALVQRTSEELQLDLPARYAQGYQPDLVDPDTVAEEIRQLREKIQRLGNVNLDAIGEQDELEQRAKFLQTQVEDLTTSKRQLEELIDTINRESSARFEQTFNTVREHFQGIFRKLFGGGKADIYLETELAPQAGQPSADQGQNQSQQESADESSPPQRSRLDILDAGIEIIARPPGKQPCSISQLSGGEKTMTCVALLLSIFKSKPSPFCVLDEVDAALDEANNQRFNLIVQEFAQHSQFIIITHSKITMQIADVLYGVTMQEEGVSKRVAVRFDQIDSQGRIAEHAAA